MKSWLKPFCSTASKTANTIMDGSALSAEDLSTKLFGLPDFCFRADRAGWYCFSNHPDMTTTVQGHHYHATTLAQSQHILADGFKVGMHHAGTKPSLAGIWAAAIQDTAWTGLLRAEVTQHKPQISMANASFVVGTLL